MTNNEEGKEKENALEKEVIAKAIKEGAVEITILKGNAPAPLQTFNRQPVNLSGTIESPKRFLDVRESKVDRLKSHALVSLSKGTITLIVNEQDTEDKYTIVGKIELGKEFEKLGINADKSYTPEDLAKALKLKRSLFKDKMAHASTIAQLRSIKAKVNQDIEKAKDDKGNVTDAMRQSVESNMPDSIQMRIPLIEGQEAVEIEVFIVLEVESGQIYCTLESMDGAEGIDEYREKAVMEEVTAIEERTTVIFQ